MQRSLDLIGCPLFRPGELSRVGDAADWLWHGYLSRGQITLLTGQWKIGKTALLACLLARLGTGAPLAGRQVQPGSALVVTEEGAGLWHARCQTFGIGDHVSFAFRPFLFAPDLKRWKMLTDNLSELHHKERLDLVVIDPLATHWPCRDENHAAGIMESLAPLRALASMNVAVLLLHHPRKARGGGGRDARGSGALSAFIDVLIEMTWYSRAEEPDRRRRLLAWSRHDATPRQWIIELTEVGRDYVQGTDDAPRATAESIIHELLLSEPDLTARDLLARWPSHAPRPLPTVLNRHLSQAVATGALICAGAGHRHEPYRYRLKDDGVTE